MSSADRFAAARRQRQAQVGEDDRFCGRQIGLLFADLWRLVH